MDGSKPMTKKESINVDCDKRWVPAFATDSQDE